MARRVGLADDEARALCELAGRLGERYGSAEDQQLLREAPLLAQEIPFRLRRVLHEFKLDEDPSVVVLSGLPIDDARLGPTPAHWRSWSPSSPARDQEILLVLFGSLLGHPVAWSTQQDGRVVHDILPIRGHEHEQLGSGSKDTIFWHTEEAFHPYRGDYLGMLCLRNPRAVPTTICSIDDVELSEHHRQVLMQPRFFIRPDESHLPKNRGRVDGELAGELAQSYEMMHRRNLAPEPIALLFGHPRAPYLRADRYFMAAAAGDPEAQEAFDALVEQLDLHLQDLALAPGELCFVDNFRAVHGRRGFEAAFDGQDRWLKRVNVVRDLRKSRAARQSADSLVLY